MTNNDDASRDETLEHSVAYRELEKEYNTIDPLADLEAIEKLSIKAKERQADKAALLEVLEEYKQTDKGVSQEEAIKRLIADYKARSIEPIKGIHSRVGKLSRATLLRWRRQVKENGWARLGGEYKTALKGYFHDHPDASNFLLLLVRDFPKATPKQLHRAVCREMSGKGEVLPTLKVLRNYLCKIKG